MAIEKKKINDREKNESRISYTLQGNAVHLLSFFFSIILSQCFGIFALSVFEILDLFQLDLERGCMDL